MPAEQPEKRRRRWALPRFAFPAALGVAAAAVAAAVVIAIGGGSSSPDAWTGGAARRSPPSTMPAPTEAGAMTLDVSPAGSSSRTGSTPSAGRQTGARVDSLGGRRAVTVFYKDMDGARRVGYTIVTGPPVHVNGGRDRHHARDPVHASSASDRRG